MPRTLRNYIFTHHPTPSPTSHSETKRPVTGGGARDGALGTAVALSRQGGWEGDEEGEGGRRKWGKHYSQRRSMGGGGGRYQAMNLVGRMGMLAAPLKPMPETSR